MAKMRKKSDFIRFSVALWPVWPNCSRASQREAALILSLFSYKKSLPILWLNHFKRFFLQVNLITSEISGGYFYCMIPSDKILGLLSVSA